MYANFGGSIHHTNPFEWKSKWSSSYSWRSCSPAPRDFYLFKWKFPKYLNRLLSVVVWGSVTICPVTTRDMTIFRQALTQLIKLHLFAVRTESDYRWWASTHSCEDNWINVNIEKLKSWLRAFCTIWQLLGRLARFDIRREMISE